MDILGKLFGSESKVRIMRLFLFNPETPFTRECVAERARVPLPVARHELAILRKIHLIKNKGFSRRALDRGRKGKRPAGKKTGGWILSSSFPYLKELQRLLIDTSLLKGSELLRRFNRAGRIKLVITAGIFIQNPDSRVDVLVVGDHLRHGAVEHAIRSIETEMGKELRYAAFETGEFNYRLGMYDKLIRDILDYQHNVILDRLGLPPQSSDLNTP
jgi:hypothetical protein